LRIAARAFNGRRDAAVASSNQAALSAINAPLLRFERGFLSPDGIPGRPWYRHLIYAPKYTYAPELFPGVAEAVERGDRALATEQARKLAEAIRRAAGVLRAE